MIHHIKQINTSKNKIASLFLFLILMRFTLSNKVNKFSHSPNNSFLRNLFASTCDFEEDLMCISSTEVHHCNPNKNQYCSTYSSDYGMCVTFKFIGESCETDDDCRSKYCKDKICSYKEDGEECSMDRMCGKSSYCRSKSRTCFKFITNEEDECNEDDKQCSPQFRCDYYGDKKCHLKGTIQDGNPSTDEALCKSFYYKYDDALSSYVCSSDYPEDESGQRKKVVAETFTKINWTSVNKLSDYNGYNMGNAELYKNEKLSYLKEIKEAVTEELWKCMEVPYLQGEMVNSDARYEVTDEDLKKLLEDPDYPKPVPPPTPKKKSEIGTGMIIFLIVLALIVVAGGIIVGVHFLVFNKNRPDSNEIAKGVNEGIIN